LTDAVREELWNRRPDPQRWSIAECVAHLNLTSEAYLPILRDALDRARALNNTPPRVYRRDPIGWLLWRTMGPPVRFRAKTTAAFVPGAAGTREGLIRDFDRLQEAQMAFVREVDGLPLGKVRVVSPFNSKVRYNL